MVSGEEEEEEEEEGEEERYFILPNGYGSCGYVIKGFNSECCCYCKRRK